MAVIEINLNRGVEASLPVLSDGEPGWATDTIKLFIGQSGTNREIGYTVGSIDHGLLEASSLLDDDHPLYLLIDGTRAMTGDLDMGTNAITNVGLVDGVDVSAHAARHVRTGADVIDGDIIEITWIPTNYFRSTAPAEVTDLSELTAHLAGLDAHVGATSLHFTEVSIRHNFITNLGLDDHTQYLLLAGRAGGQSAIGGTAVSEELTLRGTTNANLGLIRAFSPIVFEDTRAANGLSSYFVDVPLTTSQTVTALFVGGGFNVSPTISFSDDTFIWEGLRVSPEITTGVVPAFAAFTLLQALPILHAGAGAGMDPLITQVVNAAPTIQNAFATTKTTATVALANWAAQIKTTVSGAVMNITNFTGFSNAPKFSTVAGSSISFGTIRGLWAQIPTAGLFQPTAGTEEMDAYYAVDVENLGIFGGTAPVVALRSAITVGTNQFFLVNNGGAGSIFGGGVLSGCGQIQIDTNTAGLVLGDGQEFEMLYNATLMAWSAPLGSNLQWQAFATDWTLSAATAAHSLTLGFGFVQTTGGRVLNTTRITSGPYTVLATDEVIVVDTDGGAITVNLPAGVDGTHYKLTNTGSSANDITLVPNGAEFLAGVNASFALHDAESLDLHYETTEGWWT